MPTPARTTQTELIQLDEVFRWVIIWLELAAGVPRSERLGSFPGQARDYENEPRPRATGPEYISRLKGAPQPVRKGQLATPWHPRVPSVPGFESLSALLADNVQAQSATTEAERRCCQAHRLIVEFATSGVTAFGDCWINPEDGGSSIHLGQQALPRAVWNEGAIDYYSSRLNADGVWTTTIGAVVAGTIDYTNVYLDRRELTQALIARRPISASLLVKVDEDGRAERFQITWDGEVTEFRVRLAGEEGRLRAFRGLAILLQSIDRPISYHLLNYLAMNTVDTRRQGKATRDLSEDLARRVQPIAEGLYRNSLNLDQAHRKLEAVLDLDSRFASPSQLSRASWSERYVRDSPTMKSESELYKTVKENAQKSINQTLKYISEIAPSVGAYLENALVRDANAVRLASNPTCAKGPGMIEVSAYSVTWRVVVEAGAPKTATLDPKTTAES